MIGERSPPKNRRSTTGDGQMMSVWAEDEDRRFGCQRL